MEKRNDLQMTKENELINLIAAALPELNATSSQVFNELKMYNGILITPPEEEPPRIEFLTFDSLKNYKSGQSIKPGNIFLNMKKLIDSIPTVITTTISISYDIPILKVCSLLALWKNFREVLTVEISREQAVVLIALWKDCDNNHQLNVSDGFNSVNTLYKMLDESEINSTIYNRILDQLVSLHCISITSDKIWLCEWISKKYK